MLQGEVLILKLVAVDGLSTGSVMVGEVATLHHESTTSVSWNHCVRWQNRVQILPGTWIWGWHDESQSPCNQNPSHQCTKHGSSLFRYGDINAWEDSLRLFIRSTFNVEKDTYQQSWGQHQLSAVSKGEEKQEIEIKLMSKLEYVWMSMDFYCRIL